MHGQTVSPSVSYRTEHEEKYFDETHQQFTSQPREDGTRKGQKESTAPGAVLADIQSTTRVKANRHWVDWCVAQRCFRPSHRCGGGFPQSWNSFGQGRPASAINGGRKPTSNLQHTLVEPHSISNQQREAQIEERAGECISSDRLTV